MVGVFLFQGWNDVVALDMNQFYFSLLSSEERDRVENLEPFDEYEEWHLKCAHYMVLCGYRGNCARLLSEVQPLCSEAGEYYEVTRVTCAHLYYNLLLLPHIDDFW